MSRRQTPRPSSLQRRRAIIEAALSCFSELGYDRTSVADIRARSGASTGSVYHHFGGKEQLAAAVYLEGISVYQAGYLEVLERCEEARRGVLAMVRYHLRWVRENPDWARYLFQHRHADFMADDKAQLHALNQRFVDQLRAWFAPHVKAGRIRRLPREVYPSLIWGPSQDLARQWLSGRLTTDLDTAARAIAEATWRSLAGE